jgi:hypothetical protein
VKQDLQLEKGNRARRKPAKTGSVRAGSRAGGRALRSDMPGFPAALFTMN